MRKTKPHNPYGLERNSWGYRCTQLRHALGWTQRKLSQVTGLHVVTIQGLETGNIKHPALTTIRTLKNMESAYADILKAYKKAPVRLSRLRRPARGGNAVFLLPIKVRQPEDRDTLEGVGTSTDSMFFGRKTRRTMPQTGMSVRRKALLTKRNKSISRTVRAKIAAGWRPPRPNKKVQPR